MSDAPESHEPNPNFASPEQREFWNTLGKRWVTLQEDLDRELNPLGEAALSKVGVASGFAVLDVGCGCGSTTLALAQRVGPSGRVVGVDVSTPMLSLAQERLQQSGRKNVTFTLGDAQTEAFSASFDLVFSRFGVMFFADKHVAFVNLLGALKPGGKLAFVCWQNVKVNPIMSVAALAAQKVVELPPPSPPGAPGPFAFADETQTLAMLQQAGFVDIEIEARSIDVAVGPPDDLEAGLRFLLQLGPAGGVLREAPKETIDRVAEHLRVDIQPFVTAQGLVMPARVWLVTARKPK